MARLKVTRPVSTPPTVPAPAPTPVSPLAATIRVTPERSKWWVGSLMVLVAVILVMSFEAMSLALPTMIVSMRVGLNDISWTITGYMMSRTLFVGAAGAGFCRSAPESPEA